MTATLARKELQQHWPAFTLLVLLTFGAMALVGVASQFQGAAGSIFEGLRMILFTLIPLAAFVLGHRLVALEFREKTQLFLEALPLSRSRMVIVKYVFGLAVIFLLAGGAFAISAIFARHNELLTPRFLSIVAARGAAWTWFIYSLLFLFGFLGRYRFVFGIALVCALIAADSLSDVRLGEWGPFALLDGRFPFESSTFPAAALRATALLALAFTILSFLLGLAREGSVAALLGEKMSHREKMFCTGAVIAGLAVLGTAEERRKKEPYDLPDAIEEARGNVVVKVAQLAETKTRESALAAHVADELAALSEYLGVEELPPVFIVARPDLPATEFERVKLEKEDGVLAGANFASAEFPKRKFLTWLVREVVKARTFERAEREPSKWVLDGFPAFWETRQASSEPQTTDAELTEAARRGLEKGFVAADLERWLSFEKRVGADNARAVAWSGLRTLARLRGDEACRGFVRSALGQRVPHDVRAVFHDWRNPISRRLEHAAGISLHQFVSEWRAEIAASGG